MLCQVPAGLPTDRQLGPRSQLVYKFLASEIRLVETLAALGLAIIQPMIEASKGAVLKVRCRIHYSPLFTALLFGCWLDCWLYCGI